MQPVEAKRGLRSVPWSSRRPITAWVVAVLGPLACSVAMLGWREGLAHTVVAFVLLVPVVMASWLGGVGPGIAAAVVSAALFNAGFLPPFGTFDLERTEYVVVFGVFLAISLLISGLVGVARDRAAAAEEREADLRLLFDLSHVLVTERSEGLPVALGRAAERLGYVHATVQPRPAGASGTPFPLRVGATTVGTLTFIGDRPDLSAAEMRVVRTFADEVALVVQAERLGDELADADAYRRTEDVRRAMLAAASHELKSPIAAMMTSVSDVLGRERFDDDVARDVLEEVLVSTGRLEQLITNLLDMSRIEGGTLLARDDVLLLDEIVADAVDGVVARWPAATFEIALDDDAQIVRGDPVFVDRILTNLAENAARAVRTSANRLIEIRSRRVTSSMVEVRVIDHGPGLAFGDQQHMFTPFYRLREGPTAMRTGLGLAICKGFVEAMGGAIAAADTPGGGTTIAFTIASGE
jgi:two-component system sensor histidine kinase KdpD